VTDDVVFDDIHDFIAAQLDVREKRAHDADWAIGTKYDPIVVSACETVSTPLMELYRDALPERVLAEVAAMRRVLKRHRRPRSPAEIPAGVSSECCVGCGFLGDTGIPPRTPHINDCPELRDAAAPYAGRPGYKEAWRTS